MRLAFILPLAAAFAMAVDDDNKNTPAELVDSKIYVAGKYLNRLRENVDSIKRQSMKGPDERRDHFSRELLLDFFLAATRHGQESLQIVKENPDEAFCDTMDEAIDDGFPVPKGTTAALAEIACSDEVREERGRILAGAKAFNSSWTEVFERIANNCDKPQKAKAVEKLGQDFLLGIDKSIDAFSAPC